MLFVPEVTDPAVVQGRRDQRIPRPRRLAVVLLPVLLVCCPVRSEPHDVGFGEVKRFALPRTCERIAPVPGPDGRTGHVLFWSPGSSEAVFWNTVVQEHPSPARTWQMPVRPHAIVLSDIDRNGETDAAVVEQDLPVLWLIRDVLREGGHLADSLALPLIPTGLAVDDLTGDGAPDLLAFDRAVPGIILLVNDGRGRFRASMMLAEDLAVEAVLPLHLNDDGLTDLVAVEWVRRELHVFYGIGGGRFLDQATLPLSGAVSAVVGSRTRPESLVDLVLVSVDPPMLDIRMGDGFGSFSSAGSIPLDEVPTAVVPVDVNSDGFQEFLVLNRTGHLRLHFQSEAAGLSEVLDCGTGSEADGVVVTDLNGDGRPDALALDRALPSAAILWNGNVPAAVNDSIVLSSGHAPTGLWAGRLTGAGPRGIMAAAAQSRQLMFYEWVPNRGLLGHRGIGLTERPVCLLHHTSTDTTANFVLADPENGSVSFLSYFPIREEVLTATIPGVGALEPLTPYVLPSGEAGFFCLNAPSTADAPRLAAFQRLEGGKFVELSYSLNVPDLLHGAVVGDLDGDGLADLVTVSQNLPTGRIRLATAKGDSGFAFPQETWSAVLADSFIQKSYLYLFDFSDDSIPDLLMAFPHAARVLYAAVGDGRGGFDSVRAVAGDIGFASRHDLQIADMDLDDIPDLLVNDGRRAGLHWLRGLGRGNFGAPQLLVAAGDSTDFAVDDLDGDGRPDLALTDRDRDVLRLFNGRTLRVVMP